ncbi:MAG: UPF0262 family protein [Rhodospirillales bacterium]|nr:UPF0262 family protein [Rhodospirillales bacterium]
MPHTQRIRNITLDEKSVVRRSPQVEHEQKVAIFDLLEDNQFVPDGNFTGPYNLHLRVEEDRLIFDVRNAEEQPLSEIMLSAKSFRRIIKDYFLVCESYFDAIKTKAPSQIEAIDMGRRGLHNEGAELLRDRLTGKAEIDLDTARRLFTLICVLHVRG